MEAKIPYDLYPQGSGGFVTFELPSEHVSLQLLAMERATMRGDTGHLVILQFAASSVHIVGNGLTTLREHLLSGRVKTIRPGSHDTCTVEQISLYEE
jgi:hypothetical protein